MPTESTTIDLGVIQSDPPEAGRAWPVRQLLRWWLRHWRGRLRRWQRWLRRWWTATVLVGLLLPALAAATLPTPPWLTLHFAVPAGPIAGRFQLTEQALYVSGRTTSGATTLTAYRLTDGARLWAIEHQDAYFWGGAPVLRSTSQRSPEATVLDPLTGQQRWRGRGLLAVVGDRLLVRGQPDPERLSFPLTVIDLTTGDALWTLPSVSNRGYGVYRGQDEVRLIAIAGAGRLASYDLVTGVRLVAAPGPPLPPGGLLAVIGRLALVDPGDGSGLVAYDVDTLSPVWRLDYGADGAWSISGCGPVLCADRGDGAPYALDPVTGEPVWSAGWFPEGGYVLQELGPAWPADHLLLREESDRGRVPRAEQPRWLVDAGTGEPLLRLTDWQPQPRTRSAAAGQPPAPVLTHYQPGTGPAQARDVGHTWFAQLHLDPARIEVMGAAPSRPSGCVLGTSYLACEVRHAIQVWRVR